MKIENYKLKIGVILGLVILAGVFLFLNSNKKADKNFAAISNPTPTFTDNNTNESVIIKTDKGSYTGASGAEVYFSAQNVGKNAENFDIQFYFPKNLRAGVAKVEQKIASFDDARWRNIFGQR